MSAVDAACLSDDLIDIFAKSSMLIPNWSAIAFAFLRFTPVTSNLPCSTLKVDNEPAAPINASLIPSTLFVALYIIFIGSLKSPIAPPIACKFAAKSIALSGSNKSLAILKTLSMFTLNSVDFMTIRVNPSTPFLNPN